MKSSLLGTATAAAAVALCAAAASAAAAAFVASSNNRVRHLHPSAPAAATFTPIRRPARCRTGAASPSSPGKITDPPAGGTPRSSSAAAAPSSSTTSSTALGAIVDVPFGFFTTAGISLGIFNAIMRPVNRQALEERAWQRRLDEARAVRMEEDPTLTELDVIREEAEAVGGPYGPDAMERREERERRRRGGRVLTMDPPGDDDDDGRGSSSNRRRRRASSPPEGYVPMTDEEIEDFEADYGVEYDPYYDEPYEEDELPTDIKFRLDGLYGDRRYENGEVFYLDEETGLYWRQGCKPRIKKMWDF